MREELDAILRGHHERLSAELEAWALGHGRRAHAGATGGDLLMSKGSGDSAFVSQAWDLPQMSGVPEQPILEVDDAEDAGLPNCLNCGDQDSPDDNSAQPAKVTNDVEVVSTQATTNTMAPSTAFPGAALFRRSSTMSTTTSGRPVEKRMLRRSRSHRSQDFLSNRRRMEVLDSLSFVQRITQSRYFEWTSSGIIILSAVLMAVQTQARADHYVTHAKIGVYAEYNDSSVIQAFNILFAIAFFFELMLRWIAEGLVGFFFTDDWTWNIFDSLVVLMNLIEVIGGATGGDAGTFLVAPSAFRLARAIRVIRVVRVIRVMRFFRELRLMIYAIMRCAKLLCWVVLTLFLIIFIFGVSLTTGTSDYLSDTLSSGRIRNPRVMQWFGSLDRSILTLFEATYNGANWGDILDDLFDLPTLYAIVFLVYVSFSILAVTNVITGIFVDSALQCNSNDKEIVVSETIEAQRQFEASVREVFQEMDHSDAGQMSRTDFEAGLQDERVTAYFKALKLDVGDAQKLFTLLDYDASGTIDVDEFLQGCQRLRGESRAYDQAVMQLEIRWLSEALGRFQADVNAKFLEIQRLVLVSK